MAIVMNNFAEDKDVFFTERFKVLVRSERELLRKMASEVPLLEPAIKNAFRNDFYRLLRHYGIPNHMIWTTAFINDVLDPFQDITHMNSFLSIDEGVLYEMLARSNTNRI